MSTLKVGRHKEIKMTDHVLIGGKYSVDRYTLGVIMQTWRHEALGKTPLVVFIPAKINGRDNIRFNLYYDGTTLKIGCYHFSQRATRIIYKWAWAAV